MKEPRNIYKCPVRIWRKFSPAQKEMYNSIFKSFFRNSDLILPASRRVSGALKYNRAEESTFAHNAACMAVWGLRDAFKRLLTK